MRLDDWFLTPDERGNPSARIDRRAGGDVAWTEGNDVTVHVDGSAYFARLAQSLAELERGDEVRFTDWRSDGDERLTASGPTVRSLVTATSRRGVDVRGLLWRSHSDRFAFSAKENRRFAREVTDAGGQVLLDERVRRGGSHHQKLVLVRHPREAERDVAFVGGVDLSHGRRDDARHGGDEQVIELDERYGARPAWHDVQLEVRGPVVGDLDLTFRERWEDPTPLNHAGLARAWLSRTLSRDRRAGALPEPLAAPAECGSHAVQVLRTYPARRPPYAFAPAGERSVARAFIKAVERARTLIYLEDQYFWSDEIAAILARALVRRPRLQLIAVVPRYPDKDGRVSGPPGRLAQDRALAIVRDAGGSRVGVYDVENDAGRPIYVHAKVCVIDDVWATVGSDNLNRRSWTHDSELSCAVIDGQRDARAPLDPGGLGDGARVFARDLRVSLWAEHLGRAPDDTELLGLERAVELWDRVAAEEASRGPAAGLAASPRGRVRVHQVDPVPWPARGWAALAYRVVFDPDGRPWRMRVRRGF